MGLKEKVISEITNAVFKNDIELNEDCKIFLSYVSDDLFCIFTKKPLGNMFKQSCNDNLNSFFKKIGNMLITDNLNGDGCFDHENSVLDKHSCIKDKLNNYFNYNSNFVLIKYTEKKIKPLSYFTLSNGYIWSVCTNKTERKKGYMTKLFKHFIKLLKKEELVGSNDIVMKDDMLHLYLLKKNPLFFETKEFYEECGFKQNNDLNDKIIMVIKI